MSTIHIATPAGDQSQHDEPSLRSLWDQGLLHQDTHYWRDGMPEWRPLHELFPPAARTAVAPPPLPAPAYSYVKNPNRLTAFVVVMLWISLAMYCVAIISDFAQLALLSTPFTEAQAEANDLRQNIVVAAMVVVFIVTGIAFLKWIYRANVNSRGFGATDMSSSPGWAVGYYFIPIICLFRPFQGMTEVWKVSLNPKNWRSEEGSGLVGTWWMLWIASRFFGQIIVGWKDGRTVEGLRNFTWGTISGEVLKIILCLVAIKLITTIARNQEELVTRI